MVDAAGPTLDIEADAVEFEAAVEPGQWMADHRLGRGKRRPVATFGQQVDRRLLAGADPQIPGSPHGSGGGRATRGPIVDAGRADPRRPGVGAEVGLVDRIRLFQRAVPGAVGVEHHHPDVGDRVAGPRLQQRGAQPQRLRMGRVVGAHKAAFVVRRLGRSHPTRMRRSVVRITGFCQPLVQSGANVVGRVGTAPTLVAGHQHTPGRHANDTGKTKPLPDAAHGDSVPTLR
jgi:hypothetical protein